MGFNSAFKGLKLFKNPGNGRLNNLNDPDRPQCVKKIRLVESTTKREINRLAVNQNYILVNTFCCPKRETYFCLL